jgi:Family of unknown function (DUF5677)
MDSEFAKLIDDAANVATSGRWAAVNAEITRLAANPGEGNEWYVQLIGSLCSQVFSEYLHLKNAYAAEGDVSLLAWRARNLLELLVWSMYCSKSRENAHRLYEDAGRDVLGLFSAFETWGQAEAQPPNWLKPLATAKQALSQRATADGIENLDGSYKRVSDAAKECGIGEPYAVYFKILSKFAHPTSMQILAPPDEAKYALQRVCFFSRGCLFFKTAFVFLESALVHPVSDRLGTSKSSA